MRRGVGLGAPEIQLGARGFVLIAPILPLPARIVSVDAGHAWSWRIGPLLMRHSVTPLGPGCEVGVTISAAAPIELAVHVAYGPLVALVVRNLARVTTREAA